MALRLKQSYLPWALALSATTLAVVGALFLWMNGPSQINGFSVSGIGLGIAFPFVGALIASRRPENAIGWIFCGIGLSQGLDVFATQYSHFALVDGGGPLPGDELASWLASWSYAPGFGLLVTFAVLLFPTGRLPSRVWIPLAWLSAVGISLSVVPVAVAAWPERGSALAQQTDPEGISEALTFARDLQGLGLILVVICGVGCIVALISRFRRSTGDERNQMKWFTYGSVLVVVGLGSAAFLKLPRLLDIGGALVMAPVLPGATAMAILRQRLYAIDRIINRTIVYALVTGSALAVYAGTVFVVGTVAVGSSDNLTVAVATLVAAAVFRPALRRVQAFVDRRFYRRKYDAQQTIDAFGVRLREETNLTELTDDLLAVVRTTMQPETVSVWLTGSEKIAEASRLVARKSNDLVQNPPAR
jgi:hypothetical protein